MELSGIRKARKREGLTQEQLAQKLGITRATLSKYESGLICPTLDQLGKIALALNTTVYEMIGPDWSGIDMSDAFNGKTHHQQSDGVSMAGYENILPMPKMRRIPLLGTIACGTPITAEQNYDGDVDLPDDIHADFALRCKGDSMICARIYDGDICYIRQQPTVESGQIAAVLIDDEATLKRVRLYDDHIVLEAENPTYRPLTFWNEEMSAVTILGIAVAFTSSIL